MMHTHGCAHVPVIDEALRPVGMLAARDALRALLADERCEEALLRDGAMGGGYH